MNNRGVGQRKWRRPWSLRMSPAEPPAQVAAQHRCLQKIAQLNNKSCGQATIIGKRRGPLADLGKQRASIQDLR